MINNSLDILTEDIAKRVLRHYDKESCLYEEEFLNTKIQIAKELDYDIYEYEKFIKARLLEIIKDSDTSLVFSTNRFNTLCYSTIFGNGYIIDYDGIYVNDGFLSLPGRYKDLDVLKSDIEEAYTMFFNKQKVYIDILSQDKK